MITVSDTRQRLLLFNGMILFLLGLLVGFVEGKVANPRMGLAAHLEGLMNGTFLIALGAVWPHVKLSPKLSVSAYWMVLYGAYANLVVTTFAAIVGGSSLSPITGAGHQASAWQESFITAGFGTVGATMVASSILILWGLRPSNAPMR